VPNSTEKNQANCGPLLYQKRLFSSNYIVTESSLILVGFLGFRRNSICVVVHKINSRDNMDQRVEKLQSFTCPRMTR